jgi:predicted metal-dependent hydrolase
VNTERSHIEIGGVRVELVRKDIKNLHVGVYPPQGRVRVAVPLRLTDDAVRLALASRLGWIRRQRRTFLEQDRQSRREMVSGETHYFAGRRYRLKVRERDAPAQVEVRGHQTLLLSVRPQQDSEQRLLVLERWYRAHLRALAGELLERWAACLGVTVEAWNIRKAKTRWGACNPHARRIWLNLELAKKPVQCLEYIVVHELAHLIERHHNDKFAALMVHHLPDWRLRRELLNQSPLAHEAWEY